MSDCGGFVCESRPKDRRKILVFRKGHVICLPTGHDQKVRLDFCAAEQHRQSADRKEEIIYSSSHVRIRCFSVLGRCKLNVFGIWTLFSHFCDKFQPSF